MLNGDYPPGVTGADIDRYFCDNVPDCWYPDDCCKYCKEYDGDSCMKEWNNADPAYYVPERDDKQPDECCGDYVWNGEYLEEPKRPVKPTRLQFVTEGAFRHAMARYGLKLAEYLKECRKCRRDEE